MNRQVPSVPNVTDPILKNFLSAMREAVNKASADIATNASASSASAIATALGTVSGTISGLLDTTIPPLPTGLAVQGMRLSNFLTWDLSSYGNLNYTEIWRAPALLQAYGMVNGNAYRIRVLGSINWATLGATAVALPSLVNGTEYVITALGTTNWAALGVPVGVTPAVGTVFTYNGATVTGTGGTVLKTAFTCSNMASITGGGGNVYCTPALSSASLIGTSNGTIYVDSVDPGSVYAYWIRFVSNADVYGPYNSSTGVIGATVIGPGVSGSFMNVAGENIYGVNAWIAQADILELTVTDAMITGTISSQNYNGSNLGWQLDKTGGNVNLNQLTIRDGLGNIIMQSGATGSAGGLAQGTGHNLLTNTAFTVLDGWDNWLVSGYTGSNSIVLNGTAPAPAPLNCLAFDLTGTPVSGVPKGNIRSFGQNVPCSPGQVVEAQAWCLANNGGTATLVVSFWNASGGLLGNPAVIGGTSNVTGSPLWNTSLSSYTRLWGFATAPANTARMVLEIEVTIAVGQTNCFVGMVMPYLGYAAAGQTKPTTWGAGSPNGAFSTLNQITPANASTYIANLAVNTLQIAGNAVIVPVYSNYSNGYPSITKSTIGGDCCGDIIINTFYCDMTTGTSNSVMLIELGNMIIPALKYVNGFGTSLNMAVTELLLTDSLGNLIATFGSNFSIQSSSSYYGLTLLEYYSLGIQTNSAKTYNIVARWRGYNDGAYTSSVTFANSATTAQSHVLVNGVKSSV